VSYNPDMLRLARDAGEMTQAELAKASGVTQALISKLEHGLITQPSDEVVDQIASALRFPRGFFFQPERAVGFPHFHFRKRARLGAKPLARIGALINIRRMHVAKLMRSYENVVAKPIPQIDLDDSGLTPEKVAERMREYWMLPRGPVENLVELIEAAGGIVVLSRFGTDLMDGLSFRSEGLPPLFFLNNHVSGDRFRFSLAHELGHMIMHSVPDDDDKMEEEAHRFAAAFLMPPQDVRPYLADIKFTNLARVKAYWKVSIKALLKRAHTLKLITDHQYKIFSINYNKSFKDGEPVPIKIESPTRLKEIVQFHAGQLGYSAGDLASLLSIHEEDVKRAYLDQRPRIELVVSN
jgi:Zn-dependent peptidase ImmA (M78 family)/transcriptional regulator with XRE-family HTH domain